MLEIQMQNIDEMRQAFRDAPEISRRIFQGAMATTAAIFAKHTLKGDPVPYRTGYLLSSFRSQVGEMRAAWFPTARYARCVNDGTAPHVIQAVNKKVLADEKAGIIYGRVVLHPGTQPASFMQRIRDKATPDINTLFTNALGRISREIAGRGM